MAASLQQDVSVLTFALYLLYRLFLNFHDVLLDAGVVLFEFGFNHAEVLVKLLGQLSSLRLALLFNLSLKPRDALLDSVIQITAA